MSQTREKIKRVLLAGLPSPNDLSIFFRVLIILFVVTIFSSLFSYIATPAKAMGESATVDAVPDSIFKYLSFQASGCYGLSGFSASPLNFTPLTQPLGAGKAAIDRCSVGMGGQSSAIQEDRPSSGLIEIDYGPTGQLLNASASIYDTQLVQPGVTIEYFASKIKGEVFAAENPMSGRSVLGPIFILNQNMVNLAYGLVVIILIISSLNILLSSLSGVDEKVTIVQLLINAGVTLVMITFYYEIAAIIFDLTVNYGNALVASIMSPFINSRIILERLSPGGDLAIMNLLNTYQFIGVSDSILVVIHSVFAGIFPVIAQTAASFEATVGGRGNFNTFNAVAAFMQMGGSMSSTGISTVVSSFLGNKEVFATIIAWAVFFVNLKIFINLLSAFITFTIYVGFGPLIALGGINGGFQKVSDSFKYLVSLGLVFPLTFLFILLGAVAMNLFVRTGGAGDGQITKNILCKYSPSDPANTQQSIIDRNYFEELVGKLPGGNPTIDDPGQARMRNFINQNIFDTVPAKIYKDPETQKEVRDCRPSLFPLPWTFIPAPFGTIGQRQLQVQTIDALIRTFLGIVFLIMASRAPSILEEVLEVKQLSSLKGMTSSFNIGAKTFLGVGATSLSMGIPLATKAVGMVYNRLPIPGLGNLADFISKKRIAAARKSAGSSSPGGIKFSSLGQFVNSTTRAGYGAVRQRYEGYVADLTGAGFSSPEAESMALANLAQEFNNIANSLTGFGMFLQNSIKVVEEFNRTLADASKTLQTLVSLSVIDEV